MRDIDLGIPGQVLTSIGFEYGIRLLFEDRATIFIETHAVVVHKDQRVDVDPQGVGPAALTVLELLHRIVTTATASADGTLRIELDSGHTLSVEIPSQLYESWSADVPALGLRLVSIPGGSLADFSTPPAFDR